jgi:hypothetical protein
LHATHAVDPLTASVIVGQYGPAAAQDVNAVAPGRRPDAAPVDALATAATITSNARTETGRRTTLTRPCC